ncbi:MAG: alpha/beta fold hydrolase [Proteobacteria bacterium]|nr:alpha/beta fold hydrolase [Pseudomonadota bacterium]
MKSESKNLAPNLEFSTIRDSSDTLDLRFASLPGSTKKERQLAFCTGRTEWSEKYAHLPEELKLNKNTGFTIWDHRGQGMSGGARAWIDNYDTYSKDAKTVIDKVFGNKPYNLMCHSMGGLIALNGIMKGMLSPRCLVLSSPLLGLPHRPMHPDYAYKISNVIAKIGLGHLNSRSGRHWKPPFERNLLTHSADRYQVIQNPPYPVPSATFEWVKATYEATKFILNPEFLKKLNIPILVLCGTEENVVDINAVPLWVEEARKYSQSSIDLHWIQGGLHELFYESKPIQDIACTYVMEWFNKIGFPI